MYCVIYRMGGTENFRWLRALPHQSAHEAEIQALELARQGYRAIVEPYRSLDATLPRVYEPALTREDS